MNFQTRLSAADLHVVVMGDAFVGIVHPSKIYNIMSVGRPILYIGPETSHVTDLVNSKLSIFFHSSRRYRLSSWPRAFASPR